MANPIVSISVSVQTPPAPSTLQRTGAFVSSGGTTLAKGAKSLITQPSDLTTLLVPAKALASLTWSGNVVTATTTSPHGYTNADVINLTIAGAVPAGYNGSFPCTITGASTFTYPLGTNPGMETTPGTYIPGEVNSLIARTTTFFAQGSQQSVYVLEVGAGTATEGVNFLSSWITANPGVFYAYLVPRFWDGNATFLAFLATFESLTAKTYFYVTTNLQNYALYTAQMKDVVMMIEAPTYSIWPANVLTAISSSGGVVTATTTSNHGVVPGNSFTITGCTPAGYNGTHIAQAGTTGETLIYNVPADPGAESVLGSLVASLYASTGIPSTEFSLASQFQVALRQRPSSTNKVTPMLFAFVNGVTPFPTQGNAALLSTLLTANVNLIGTGAAGGISETLIQGGNMADGNPFKYWYSVDYIQINLALDLTAFLINGANNPSAPVDYNQPGVNGLQNTAITTMNTAIGAGLVLNPVKALTLDAEDYAAALDDDTYSGFTLVNADPFGSYVAENPSDYEAGIYNGISVEAAPLRGFESITVNLAITNFAT